MKYIKIPTAEEIEMMGEYDDYNSMMRDFAKMHVKAALNAAYKATSEQSWIDNFINLEDKACKKAIIDSYPLSNIE